MAISNFFILLRFWVLWGRNTRLMYWTGAAYAVTQIASFTNASVIVAKMQSFIVYDSKFYTCALTTKGGFNVASLWLPGLAFEWLILGVALWNAINLPTKNSSRISKVLYDQGKEMIFFLVLFALRVLNLILGIVAPVSLIFLGMLFIWCASTMTTSHFILNLRKMSEDRRRENNAGIEF